MLLKDKKTGEIVTVFSLYRDEDDKIHMSYHDSEGSFKVFIADNLGSLCETWEDVLEEPKEYWFIDYDGGIIPFNRIKETATDRMMKAIGNYFETREKAEKAVEKLKAWKRLKDYNVKFNLDFVRNRIDFTYSVNNPLLDVLDAEEQIFNNMKIVFGDEE
jgi:hypothetical protein